VKTTAATGLLVAYECEIWFLFAVFFVIFTFKSNKLKSECFMLSLVLYMSC